MSAWPPALAVHPCTSGWDRDGWHGWGPEPVPSPGDRAAKASQQQPSAARSTAHPQLPPLLPLHPPAHARGQGPPPWSLLKGLAPQHSAAHCPQTPTPVWGLHQWEKQRREPQLHEGGTAQGVPTSPRLCLQLLQSVPGAQRARPASHGVRETEAARPGEGTSPGKGSGWSHHHCTSLAATSPHPPAPHGGGVELGAPRTPGPRAGSCAEGRGRVGTLLGVRAGPSGSRHLEGQVPRCSPQRSRAGRAAVRGSAGAGRAGRHVSISHGRVNWSLHTSQHRAAPIKGRRSQN